MELLFRTVETIVEWRYGIISVQFGQAVTHSQYTKKGRLLKTSRKHSDTVTRMKTAKEYRIVIEHEEFDRETIGKKKGE